MTETTGHAVKATAGQVDEEALNKAAREGYAIRCKTYGPRTLQKYASDEIMRMQLDNARVIVLAYLASLSPPVERAPQPGRLSDLEAENARLRSALEQIVNPISEMARRAEAAGRKLDGMMANFLSKDPEHLKGIARAALSTKGEA